MVYIPELHLVKVYLLSRSIMLVVLQQASSKSWFSGKWTI